MEQNRIWELIAKKHSGEASPEEQLELGQYSLSHLIDSELLLQLESLWAATFKIKEQVTEEESAAAWESLQHRMHQSAVSPEEQLPRPDKRPKKALIIFISRFAAAASIIVLVSLSVWWLRSGQVPDPVKMNTVSTRNGSRSKIELPDGTKVWLNAGSRVIYSESYGKKNRDIQLIGEAYFDVTHNAGMPFIIYTKDIIVKVLGTVFNVKAYPQDKTTEASLVRGSIEVSFPGRPSEKLILSPSQKITLVNTVKPAITDSNGLTNAGHVIDDVPEMTVSKINYDIADSSVVETSWVANKFIFRNKSFGDLVKEMERWFNVSIEVQHDALLEEKFTGTFNSGSNVTEALKVLQYTYPFRFVMDKQQNKLVVLP